MTPPNPIFKFALREDLKYNNKIIQIKNPEELFLPKRGEPFATGYDVRAAFENRKSLILEPGEFFKIPLGFRVIPEEGWWFQLHPRSSSFTKKNMHCLIGIVDEHYSHEVMFCGQYLPELKFDTTSVNENDYGNGNDFLRYETSIRSNNLTIHYGDAIGQIVPVKRIDMEVTQITNEEFGKICGLRNAVRNGGFGSTTDGK